MPAIVNSVSVPETAGALAGTTLAASATTNSDTTQRSERDRTVTVADRAERPVAALCITLWILGSG
ncbi:MAG: hypothetical protein ACR2L8_13925 [Solirubrobacteraceae bacterium]